MVSNQVKSVWLGISQGCGRKQILPWSFYDRSLISSSCPRGLLKISSKADVLIPAADDTGRVPASQLKSPFQDYSESLSKHLLRQHNAADTTTFFWTNSESITKYPLRRQQQLPSCTGNHFPAAATNTPAPATNSLQKQLPVLHRRPPSCTSSYQFYSSNYQSWTSNHFPAPADTSNY